MTESILEMLNPGKSHAGDPEFPHAPEDWSKAQAEAVAKEEGMELSDDHWEVIRGLQAYFSRHEGNINARELHDALDEHFHSRGGIKYLYEILPGGPVAQGCRLAGLEPPAGAVDRSFGSVL